jgi:3',5'-cyclic AMP phosphodiesterase CpdA
MSDFSSIILRFRDLATTPGTTILEHQKIIDGSKKFVWWGWWGKPGETVPDDEFRAAIALIDQKGPLDIFLFDSGTNELHRTKLVEIEWDNKRRNLIGTPDADATPGYYAKRPCYGWFKLTHIETASEPESDLKNWSYAQTDGKSAFQVFDNKLISSSAELRSQDRTLWFIRPRRDADAVHEVRMYDQGGAPANYPASIVQARTNKLLWISDPHFSEKNHDFPHDTGESLSSLSDAIRHDLEYKKITGIGGMLISGDFTWEVTRDEFRWAAKFIDDVRSWSGLTPREILICPGNHDFAYTTASQPAGTRAVDVTLAASAEYRKIYSDLFSVTPNASMSCGRHFWLPDGQMVDIVSLNSSLLQQGETFRGQGFIGKTQLEEAAAEMKWSRNPTGARAYRICMIHHHVVPIIYREHPEYGYAASVVHDAGALIRWLADHEVDLVLHGHMHLPSVVKHSSSPDYPALKSWHEVTIAALGSSGVIAKHRPDAANSYGLIEFNRDGVKITVRSIIANESSRPEERGVYTVDLPYNRTHA